MNKVEKEYLELMTIRKQSDMSIQKIISCECKPALNKGENFMSSMMRYKLVVLLGSGETALKHVIVKSLPESKEHSTFLQENSFFRNEIHVYSNILRDMKALMEEFQDKRDPLWCEMVSYQPYHKLILQDLQDYQFYAMDRREHLDYQHILFSLKSIARFHAMSAVLLKRCLVRPGEFEPYGFSTKIITTFMFGACIKVMAKAVEQSWGSEWSHLPNLLLKAYDKTYQTMQELVTIDDTRFNVICHGDSWTSNIMFKHVEDTKIPSGVRFVDFQITHYNSFAWDITYFFYTSILPKFRREKYNEFLLTYHKALIDNLKFYNYPESDFPTFQHLSNEMERLKYFGMHSMITIHSITKSQCDEPFDMGKSLNNFDNPEVGVNINIFSGPAVRDLFKDDINDFIKQGFL